jgi:hypothetical protein
LLFARIAVFIEPLHGNDHVLLAGAQARRLFSRRDQDIR